MRTPDGWTLLRSVFEERGYDVTPTDKAAAALGQLELIGGAENLEVLASSKVRELLRVLSRRRGENRPYLAERKTLKFEHFRGDGARRLLATYSSGSSRGAWCSGELSSSARGVG